MPNVFGTLSGFGKPGKNHMKKVDNTAKAVVVRLGHMGDVALTTGVLEHWRTTRNMRFVFVTRESFAPILHGHPAVEQVWAVDEQALGSTRAWLRECNRLAREFGHLPLLDLHGSLRSRILGMRWPGTVRRYPKLGLQRRIFSRTGARRFQSMLERTNVPQRYAMTLERDHTPADALLPQITLFPEEQEQARSTLPPLRADGPLVALHPYATHPSKQWPEAHWRSLTELLEQAEIDWIVVGRSKTPLFPESPNDLTNRTNLRTTCALLAEANTMVTNDSGPMHLASGVGTPVVALFGPTAKAWGFYPAGTRDMVLERDMDCRPCSLHGAEACANGLACLSGISAKQAMRAVQTVLDNR